MSRPWHGDATVDGVRAVVDLYPEGAPAQGWQPMVAIALVHARLIDGEYVGQPVRLLGSVDLEGDAHSLFVERAPWPDEDEDRAIDEAVRAAVRAQAHGDDMEMT